MNRGLFLRWIYSNRLFNIFLKTRSILFLSNWIFKSYKQLSLEKLDIIKVKTAEHISLHCVRAASVGSSELVDFWEGACTGHGTEPDRLVELNLAGSSTERAKASHCSSFNLHHLEPLEGLSFFSSAFTRTDPDQGRNAFEKLGLWRLDTAT